MTLPSHNKEEVLPFAEYQEHHFNSKHDVGIAWNGNRLWVCLDGAALFRAKIIKNKLFIEYTPPNV